MIKVDKLRVAFGGHVALNDVTAMLDTDIVGIIGPNGAGKTTLLNVLSGFITPSAGTIHVDGVNILELRPHERARWGLRRGFQREQVPEHLSVEDNVRVILDSLASPVREKSEQVAAALEYCGLLTKARVPAGLLNAFERRLIELARCMVGEPKVIMLDEPGGGLSQNEMQVLREKVGGIKKFCGAQVLIIDHDVEFIQSICQSAIVLDFGSLIASGPTATVLDDPRVRTAYLGIEETAP